MIAPPVLTSFIMFKKDNGQSIRITVELTGGIWAQASRHIQYMLPVVGSHFNTIITEKPISWSGVPEALGQKPSDIFALTKTKALDEGGLKFNQQIYFPWCNRSDFHGPQTRTNAVIIPVTRGILQLSLLLENTSSYVSEPALSRWQTPRSPAAS